MNILSNVFNEQANCIINNFSDVEIKDDSILISTEIKFDYIDINVKKCDGVAGWKKKNKCKNGYSIVFKITPISRSLIEIEAFSYGLLAEVLLTYINNKWTFINNDNESEYSQENAYLSINFTNSLNLHNQLTDFIVQSVYDIMHCLNMDKADTVDSTVYDSDSFDKPEIEGDLLITINEHNIDVLQHRGLIRLSKTTAVKIDRTMFGKKIIMKDNERGCFYPLDINDFTYISNKDIIYIGGR